MQMTSVEKLQARPGVRNSSQKPQACEKEQDISWLLALGRSHILGVDGAEKSLPKAQRCLESACKLLREDADADLRSRVR